MPYEIKLAPSILSADFSRLGEHINEATEGGADYIHVDVMDGNFVPNITFGPGMVETLRKCTKLPLDVHLMVQEPDRVIPWFAKLGADILTVHAEACKHLHRVVNQIKESGVKAGVAINPATPVSTIEEILPEVDLVLVMTVNPGFPAQSFIDGAVHKIRIVREKLDNDGLSAELEVDGGINLNTVARVVEAGARVLVAGSAIFEDKDGVAVSIGRIKKLVGELDH